MNGHPTDPPPPPWYFIPHPASHRAAWRKAVEGQDGKEIATMFGLAEVIVAPPPDDDDDWVCDLCNDPIGVYDPHGNPIPVISFGSYGLCSKCVARAIRLGDLGPNAEQLFPNNSVVACGNVCCRGWMARVMAAG